jgi:excinuclease ABC subunit C
LLSELLRKAARKAAMNPGIYKMLDANGKVLYVGKAKYLKNRLLSYTRTEGISNRIKMMLSKVRDIEVVVVKTEIEALLLESNLIKQLKPFYNILLKDDKTFPYIVIDKSVDFPRIFKFRTLKAKGANFYGPYPAINSLDETLKVIQKAFLIRNCTDHYFSNRERPCLQYFIKRCSAPCLGKISKEEYKKRIDCAEDLLSGRDEIARKILIAEMRESSEALDFERAAFIRDRLKAISEIQSKQYVQISSLVSIDFIAVTKGVDKSVAVISFFRIGKNVGSEKFIIQNSSESDDIVDVLESFIVQFYRNINIPEIIVTSHSLGDNNLLREFCGNNSKIVHGKTGVYGKIIESCLLNAQLHLKKESTNEFENQIAKLCNLLKLSKVCRIEAYDNSHIQGTNACGVMVVFEHGKIQKEKSRRFNINSEDVARGGDDVGMMRFSLRKRFRSKTIIERPEIILIDGGKAQVFAARQVVDEICGIENDIKILGIAKQNDRKMGYEKLVFENGEELSLGHDDLVLSFLIMLRNEAHRAAITFHRKKRSKSLVKSMLDDIPSIGENRRKKLLEHFGSIDAIKKAFVEDLKMVKGIDKNTAKLIFSFFNRG